MHIMVLKTNKIKESKKKAVSIIVILIIAAVIVFIKGLGVQGPFIFFDESTYFQLGYNIHNNWSYSGHTDYNPLYPLLISIPFVLKNLYLVYWAIRIINALAFASILFPLYFICSKFFSKRMSLVISAVALLLPWNVMTSQVMAESLFFPLYAWCIFFYINFIEKKDTKSSIMLGTSLGLLFLTKQAPTIILVMSITLSLVYNFIKSKKLYLEKKSLKHYIYIYIILLILSVPWMIRNMFTKNASLLGYSRFTDKFFAYNLFSFELIEIMLNHVSYLIFATYFIFIFIFVIKIIYPGGFDTRMRSFSIVILLNTLGLLMLLTVFLFSLRKESAGVLTAGRYMTNMVPYIGMIGVYGLTKLRITRSRLIVMILLSVFFFIILFFFSPLAALGAGSTFDNPDTSVLNQVFLSGKINYVFIREYSAINSLIISSIPFIFSWLIILLRYLNLKEIKYNYFIMLLIPLIICSSIAASHNVAMVSSATKDLNQIYMHIANKQDLDAPIVYDNEIKSEMNNIVNSFWRKTGIEYSFVSPLDDLDIHYDDFYLVTGPDKQTQHNLILENNRFRLFQSSD